MKKLFSFLLVIPALAACLVSCAGEKTDARNLQGRWTIAEVEGDKVATERPAFIEFDMNDMRIHGNAGCNTFNAGFTLDKDDASKIEIKQAVSTMMACPDMDTENKVLKAIDSVHKVKKDKDSNKMLLTNSVGKTLFVLTKN